MTEFKKRLTLSLQMTSLCNFMSQLSYGFSPEGYFVTEQHEARAFQKISFQKAVELHNSWSGYESKGLMAWSGWLLQKDGMAVVSCLKGFKVPVYNYNLAKAAKLVEQVKLQYNKKADFPIFVQSDMVKFTHPAYIGAFGFDKED